MESNKIKEQLLSALKTGFIDESHLSNPEYVPEILINDQSRNKKVLSTIQRELSECDNFIISAAFLTMSGFASLSNKLFELREKGVKGKILVSQYLNFTEPEALKRLLDFDNISSKIVTEDDFHSKGFLFKKGNYYTLIIGSSNLTAKALSTNQEWNLKVKAHKNSELIKSFQNEFLIAYKKAIKITEEYISEYAEIYSNRIRSERNLKSINEKNVSKLFTPNKMQKEALRELNKLRSQEATKAILISATGTGKTLLSAFDAKNFKPKKFLFVVHRENIARAAMSEYKKVFGNNLNCSVYIGADRNIESDYIFSTIQTLSRDNHLQNFNPDHFDYIVIDETHRSGAKSYKKILNYFNPKFLLGMTATPDRTDGYDIFTHFDHNIAYEIRLQRALSENMLSPFHYYGVTDIMVNGELIDDNADFNLLTRNERVDRILEKISYYGCCDGNPRGLIFCSRKDEAKSLSDMFNQRGYNTISLTGENSEAQRKDGIEKLESGNSEEKLDYIFTVDIFNEGIDIPKINQVIMLRPTQSSIIFVQQLGRGLRKVESKDYLTVIDFIGNYSNNYLIPIALFGDRSYSKDKIRKLIVTGSEMIPGSSTVNFDKITKERIFESIDNTNMQTKLALKTDYDLLKFKIGRPPKMVDFHKHDGRDPYSFVDYKKSYFNFVVLMGDISENSITEKQKLLLEIFSKKINNSKSIEESLLLRELIHEGSITFEDLISKIEKSFDFITDKSSIINSLSVLNLNYHTLRHDKKTITYSEYIGDSIANIDNNKIIVTEFFKKQLSNKTFRKFLLDSTYSSIRKFKSLYKKNYYKKGFVLYRKYSRSDVLRLLGHKKEEVNQNISGYFKAKDNSFCPIFVTYKKDEDIADTIKYQDKFLDNHTLQWESKNNRTMNSPEIVAFQNEKNIRLPLFIKKSDDEGTDHYYMGELKPIDGSFVQEKKANKSIVRLKYEVFPPVEQSLYNYITSNEE